MSGDATGLGPRVAEGPAIDPPGPRERFLLWAEEHHAKVHWIRWRSSILALCAAITAFFWGISDSSLETMIKGFLHLAINVAATLLGFFLAGLTIMIPVANSEVAKTLQRHGDFMKMIDRLWASIRSLFVFLGAGLLIVALAESGSKVSSYCRLVPAILALCIVHAGLSCYWVARLMMMLVKKYVEGETRSGPASIDRRS